MEVLRQEWSGIKNLLFSTLVRECYLLKVSISHLKLTGTVTRRAVGELDAQKVQQITVCLFPFSFLREAMRNLHVFLQTALTEYVSDFSVTTVSTQPPV